MEDKEPKDNNVICQDNDESVNICESKDTEAGSVQRQKKKKKRKHKEINEGKQTDGTNKANESSVKDNPSSDSSYLEKNDSGKTHKKKHKVNKPDL